MVGPQEDTGKMDHLYNVTQNIFQMLAGVFLDSSRTVENTNLWCRPCSQNGSLPCYRKEQYCMTKLTPDIVINEVSKVII